MYHTQDSFKEMRQDFELKLDIVESNSTAGDSLFICKMDSYPDLFIFQKNFFLGTFKLNSYYQINIEIPNSKKIIHSHIF